MSEHGATSLIFDVLWRDHGAQKGMHALGVESDTTQKKMSKFKTVAAVGLIAAGAAVVEFGKKSVEAYSEAQGSQAALQFALSKFPKMADVSAESLETLNKALSRKTRYDDDAIASGQAVLAQFDLTGKQVEAVTPLLLDYADKTGKSVPDAAKDLGKALLGNAKALKNIGISYKATGDRTTDFANITTLMRQKVGGFAETEGKTLSGQLAIMHNQFEDLEKTVGKKLVPALTAGAEGLNSMVEFVGDNADAIIPLVGGIAGLAGVVWGAQKAQLAWTATQKLVRPLAEAAVGGLNLLKAAFTGVELTADASGKAMRIAQLSIPVVGIALFAATTAMAAWASKSHVGTKESTDFSEAMKGISGEVTLATAALNENARAVGVKALQDAGAYDAAKKLGISYQDVTDAAFGQKDALDRVKAALLPALALNRQSSKQNADTQASAALLNNTLIDVAGSASKDAEAENVRRIAMQQSQPETKTLGQLTDDLAQANSKLRGELQKVIDKLTILKDGALSEEQANENWQGALDNLTKSVKDNGKSLDVHTEKGRNNRQSIIAAMQALNDKTTADYKNAAGSKNAAKAVNEANQRYQDNRRDLEKAAIAAGYSKGEVKKMIDQYLKTPKQLRTEVSTPGVRGATSQVHEFNRQVQAAKNHKVNLGVNFQMTAAKAAANFFKSVPGSQASGFSQLPRGYSDGGYTGNLDPHAPAGLVHGDEMVIKSKSRRKIEKAHPGWLDIMNETGQIPGYYSGGLVRHLTAQGSAGRVPRAIGQYAGAADKALNGLAAETYRNFAKKLVDGANALGGSAGLGNPANVSNPRGLTSYHGGTFTRLFVANLKAAERAAGKSYTIYQGGFRPSTSYSGSTHNMDAIDAHVDYGLLRAFRSHVGAMGDRTGLGNWMSHMHGVPAPGRGYGSPSARAQYRDYVRRGGAKQSLKSPWGLDAGGVVTQDGLYRLAEKRPERVLSSRQSLAYERIGHALERSGGAVNVTIHVSAPNYVGTPRELASALETLNDIGGLDKLKRSFRR